MTPRTVITTDPELDDLNSMLRLLLYSNEINIAGLIYSSSMCHHKGDSALGVDPYRWPPPGARLHIDEAVDSYTQVHTNLVAHDARYPSPDQLRSLIREGNVIQVGDMREDTEGSNLIKEILLDDQPDQVFLQAWGGLNTIARAEVARGRPPTHSSVGVDLRQCRGQGRHHELRSAGHDLRGLHQAELARHPAA